MKIAIGCDHAGAELKENVTFLLSECGYNYTDYGTHDQKSVDYPDFGSLVSSAVSNGTVDKGILICGTGIGMSIVANKFHGVRAALCYDIFTARMSRLHNDANILVLGSRVTGKELAEAIVAIWLTTGFEGGRHKNRLEKISELEGLTCDGTKLS